MTAFNENVTVIEELWVFLDPNRRKAGERLLSTLLLLPALPKRGITDTVLQLFGVFPTAQLFQPTETRHRKQQPNEIPISWIVWWALDCCGSQSWGPASLTPCLREPALLLGQHSEPAQGTGSCSCFSQKEPLSSCLHWACPGCQSTQAGGTVAPGLSSPWRHSPAELLSAHQSPLSARPSVTLVQQYLSDDAAEV